MTSNVVAPYAYVLYLHNASVQKGEINCHVRILGRAVISDIFSHNLPGVTVNDGKQICRSILSMYLHIRDVHLPHIIRFLDRNNGFHNPPGWTAVIVSIVEEIVLLHYAENLLPVAGVSGSLQVFADLLVTIAANSLPSRSVISSRSCSSVISIIPVSVILSVIMEAFRPLPICKDGGE